MTEELDVLLDISRRLDLVEIPHMVTGSIAMSLYARPRMTRDIDVVVVLHTGDVDRLVASLEDSYYIDTGAARRAVLQPGMFNFRDRILNMRSMPLSVASLSTSSGEESLSLAQKTWFWRSSTGQKPATLRRRSRT